MGPWKLDGGYELFNPLYRCGRGKLFYDRAWIPARPAAGGRPAREGMHVHTGDCMWVKPNNTVGCGEQQLLLAEAFYRHSEVSMGEGLAQKPEMPSALASTPLPSGNSEGKNDSPPTPRNLRSECSEPDRPSSQRSLSSPQSSAGKLSPSRSRIPVHHNSTSPDSGQNKRARRQRGRRLTVLLGGKKQHKTSSNQSSHPVSPLVPVSHGGFMLGRVFYWQEDKQPANRKLGATELIITNDIVSMPLDAIDGVQHVEIARPSQVSETKRFFCQTRFDLETMCTHPLLSLESLDKQFEPPMEEGRREYTVIFRSLREARLRLSDIQFFHSTTFLPVSKVELENDYDSGLELDTSWRDKESEVQMRQLTDVSPSEREFFLMWNRHHAAAPLNERFLDTCRSFALVCRERILSSKYLLLDYKLHLATLIRRSLVNPLEAHELFRLVVGASAVAATAQSSTADVAAVSVASAQHTHNSQKGVQDVEQTEAEKARKEVVVIGDSDDDDGLSQQQQQQLPTLFAGCVFCSSGLSFAERKAAFKLAQRYGARTQRKLDKCVTHLFMHQSGGLKWEFACRRTDLNIETVRPEWLQACVDRKKLLDCAEFRIAESSSQPRPSLQTP